MSPQILEKIFLGNFCVKFGHFSGKSYVKLRHFVNFSYIYFRQKRRAPLKLTELPRLWLIRLKLGAAKCPDTSGPILWGRSVFVPKCLMTEVSGSSNY